MPLLDDTIPSPDDAAAGDSRRIAPGVLGWLESPRPGDVVTDCLMVSGWAFSRSGVLTDIRVKGAEAKGHVSCGLPRPDVAAAYHHEPHALLSGFSGLIELPRDARGWRRLELWGTERPGGEMRLFSTRVRVGVDVGSSASGLAALIRAALTSAAAEPRALLSSRTWRGGLVQLGRIRGVKNEIPAPSVTPRDLIRRMEAAVLQQFLASGSTLRLAASAAPRVSVVIVVWNQAELTFRCLRALSQSTGVPIEVIVVDNSSTDQTARLLARVDGLSVIANDENRGFIVAANQGARAARGELLLFLNNDAELLPESIERLAETITRSSSIGAAGGKLIFPDGQLQEAGSIIWSDGSCEAYGRGDDPTRGEYNFERDVDFCSGALLLTRRDSFMALGGFDDRYKPAYYEDADYCVRLWKSGARVIYQPLAAAVHLEFGSAPSSEHAIQLQIARRHLFVAQHADWLTHQRPRGKNLRLARARSRGRRSVLLIDDALPDPALGAGFPRATQLLSALQELSVDVVLYSTAGKAPDRNRRLFPRVEVVTGAPSDLRGFLQSRLPELSLIIVSRPHNMRYLKASCGSDVAHQVPVIYDAEAVAALREVRRRQLNDSVSSANARQLIDEEVRLARGCHAVLVVNATEQRHFQDAGVPNVTILSHALAPSPTPAPFDRRQGMLFVGAFDPSSPNEDSANVLIDEILPAVNEIARRSVPLVLAGANMPPRLRSLRREGVSTFANVPDLAPLYNEARVFVAPTRYSAGIPLKILEAAAFGLPVVCSAMLADQLGWQPRVELLVADSAEEFAGAVVAVHENETRWSQLRAAGLRRIATDCSIEQFRRVAADVVEAVLNGEVIAATPRPSSPLPLT